MIERFGEDDSVERLYVQFKGKITQIEKIASGGGRTSRYDFEGGFGTAEPLDNRYLVPLPDRDLPFRTFEDSERAPKEKP